MNEINFIFRLLKRIFIIGLLVGGGWLYFNDARVQATANQTSIPSTGRWATNQATVYVNTNNAQLDAATNTAIQNWNQTGAFTFKPVNNQSKADIVVTTMNRSDSNAAGLTKTSSNSLTRRFMHATVYLNTYYLTDPSYGYSQERIVNTAEHELGHAIGLDHTNAVSVMQPAGSFYTIQPDDVQAVQKLYANNK